VLFRSGATGNTGNDGHNSLVFVVDEDPGTNCLHGGKKIDTGLDANRSEERRVGKECRSRGWP